MVNCPKCGTENTPGAQTCRMCAEVLTRMASGPGTNLIAHSGTVILQEMPESIPAPPTHNGPAIDQRIICESCGHANSRESAYCSFCGTPRFVPQTVVMMAVPPPAKGHLRLIGEGGNTETVYELNDETIIGRQKGDITFPHDGFLSERHARIVRRGDDYVLTDEGSRNGVYIKIQAGVKLVSGDSILVGRQFFQFTE